MKLVGKETFPLGGWAGQKDRRRNLLGKISLLLRDIPLFNLPEPQFPKSNVIFILEGD